MYKNHQVRKDADDYQTPVKLASELCRRLSEMIVPPKIIFEPSAGLGAFVIASREQWPSAKITAVEVRSVCQDRLSKCGADAVSIGQWEIFTNSDVPDLIIGNPPYRFAQNHIEIALRRVKPGGYVAFLLRMAFLNSQERVRSFWDKKPGLRFLMPLAQRPSFTGDGCSEHSEYAFMVWQRDYKGNAEILPHVWVFQSIRQKDADSIKAGKASRILQRPETSSPEGEQVGSSVG